jgi:protein CpxP
MNLKLTSTLLFALVLGTAATPLLRAQDQTTTTAPAEGKRGKGKGARGGRGAEGRGAGMMSPDARVEMLDRELKLTADQKTKLTDIFTKARDEMRDDMQNAKGGDQKAARQKMQQSMQATRDQVAAVLTDEQKKKFEEMGPGMGQGGQRGGKGPGRGQGSGKRKQGDTN